MSKFICLGNPPYGKGGLLAIKILNKCGDISDDIRLVMPKSIRKPFCQNKIRTDLICTKDLDCEDSTFPNGIRAVVQHWGKTDVPRGKIILSRTHDDFQFLKYEERFRANVFVGEFGCGPSGRVKTENFTHYAKGHYFILAKDEKVIEKLVLLEPKFRAAASQCNGRFHLSKGELVEIYTQN